jgi:hypothetical protein
VAKAAGKQPELHKRPPLSERALAARRMNALKGGRPAGGMNVDKLAFRDRFRAKEVELSAAFMFTDFHQRPNHISKSNSLALRSPHK